jgi:hypothetical protein
MSPAGLGPENALVKVNRPIFSSERILHKDYIRKFSVGKLSLVVGLKEVDAKTN